MPTATISCSASTYPEIGGKIAVHPQPRRSGIPEGRGHPEGAEEVEDRLANRRLLRCGAVARHCNLLLLCLREGPRQRTIGLFRTIMITMRSAGAALALAILAVSTPAGRSDAANQVIEMPDGLKYTDSKT